MFPHSNGVVVLTVLLVLTVLPCWLAGLLPCWLVSCCLAGLLVGLLFCWLVGLFPLAPQAVKFNEVRDFNYFHT
jgi:ABC-type polysaccharide/polyol phosphate export permease